MKKNISHKFFEKVCAFLEEKNQAGRVQKYILNISRVLDASAAIINGKRYTKAPDQKVELTETQIYVELKDKQAVDFTFYGCAFDLFESQFERSLSTAVVLDHSPILKKQKKYPVLELCSPELLRLVDDPLSGVIDLLQKLEKKAAKVEHSGLMSREVACSINSGIRYYADSSNNKAIEESASITLSVSYYLSDTQEFYSDVFGVIPTESDLERVVSEASKNLLKYDIKVLDSEVEYAVLLMPRAVSDLFSDLIFSNLDARTLIDRTGRWSISQFGQNILNGVSITDNPHISYSPFSSSFDSEGVPSSSVEILKCGILNHPLLTSLLWEELNATYPEIAQHIGLTGHADSSTSASFTNLLISFPNAKHFDNYEKLIAHEKNVVVVPWLTGMSADAVSGQFALDAEGAKVFKDGVLQYSTSLTLRGNFFEALEKEFVAGPIERIYNIQVPALLTKNLKCVSKGQEEEDGDE